MLTKIYRMISGIRRADDVNEIELLIIGAWFEGELTDYQYCFLVNGIKGLKEKFNEDVENNN